MTDLKITEATVQLVVNEQEPVFLQVLRGPIVVSGGGGVTVHNDLTGRSDADTHPISSITGLAAALAAAGNVDSVNGQTGTVSLDLDDLTDVDTTTDPPDADDVLAWDGVTWTPATLTALGAPGLSNATPADLGTADPGVGTEASRADHVHDMPTAADVGAVDVALVGAPDGVAELDSGGRVPSAQLPAYVDDVVEAANFAALPGTGETGKIYVTLDNNLTFRWSGSAYVEISASLALGETSSTAHRGDHGATAYTHSQTSGNPHGTAIGDISGLQTAIDAKAPLASPTFTGTPAAPTAAQGTNTTQVATTAMVQSEVASLAPKTRTVGTGLGTSGTVNLDMASLHGTIQTITLSGNPTFTTLNRAAGREVTLVLAAGGSTRTITWPSWLAVGAALPTSLASGKTLVVSVTCTDTTDAATIAASAVQP